ncbi:hypothetical protein P3H15_47590 [Rhodococcus sp. T2V]|uniref:hypothetical protein n=1 Tax=Rhodococcus sp. T2V TaxID=3034164 RepID=UPI0023E21E5F|nr:hypothetical protein [Rhodococcus sp. T2V]MDF3312612.1 hypothetical protein [Rhodococcus sp. T2V]
MGKATTELGDTPRAGDPVQVRGLSEMAATGVVGRVAATAITAEENAGRISRPVSPCSSEWVLEDPAEARQAFWNRDRRQGNAEIGARSSRPAHAPWAGEDGALVRGRVSARAQVAGRVRLSASCPVPKAGAGFAGAMTAPTVGPG